MIPFDDLGRWRPDALLGAADQLGEGGTIRHFGHLHDVDAVVRALRHTARKVRAARARALETADLIAAEGWGFHVADGDIVVRETSTTVITYDADLDRVEDLMTAYASTMADALSDIGIALDDLQAVIVASRRDPHARAHPGPRRPLRPTYSGPARRDRRNDPWSWCWDR